MSLLSPGLQAFVAVSRRKSVHGAAADLHLTQTGVTQRIRALETQLGATLFLRSRKGMQLTSEGEALLRYCHAAQDLEGEALARISGAGRQTEVRVSILGPTSVLRSRVIPAALPVLKRFPRVLASFDLDDTEGGDDALRSGRAHLAVLPPERVAKEMEGKPLKPEKYVLVGPVAWKSRPVREVVESERILDFDPTDPMTHAYLRKHGLLDSACPERHFVNSTESLVELFEAEIGYGVLTEEFARPHLRAGRIALLNGGRSLENRLALAWYPRPQMPDYLAALIKAIG